MTLLIFFIVLSIGVSFICSMLEAIILSVTPSYLTSLKKRKPLLYQQVEHLKKDIEKPLASILTFNTIAHTIGAAGAGAEAQRLFGSQVLAVFSAVLTFAILFFSEIIPKSIGASAWKSLLPLAVKILKPMVIISYPLVWMSEKISLLFKSKKQVISREELEALADLGLKDGALEKSEYNMLVKLLKFKQVKVNSIMTPAKNVKSLNGDLPVKEAYPLLQTYTFSRLIVLCADKNDIKGYVLRTALLTSFINQEEVLIKDIDSPILTIPHTTELSLLLQKLIERREHISAVVDDFGQFVGIATLEDIIECMLGLEIFDEQD